ncbi:MAG: helical backbone metal receptor [Planctomycetota bacterium]|nr:helical backbone metal receptor [Planctomycetota bacterium]
MTEVRRIVSLVPSLTKTMFDLGLGDQLVGVTRYCVDPADGVSGLKKVGGTKNPKLSDIVDLEPDLVLVNSEENRTSDIVWLEERFEVYETMPRTIYDVTEMLRGLSERVDCWDEAESFILQIQAELTRIEIESLGRHRIRVFAPIWKGPWMSFNRDTYLHDLLETVGADNVCADYEERYPVIPDDEIEALQPDLVLLPSEPFEFGIPHQSEILRSGLFPGCQVLLVDGRDYTWHGSMTGAALGRVHDFLVGHRRPVAVDG